MRCTAAQEQACCRDVSSPSSQGLAQRRCHLLEPDGENCSRPGLVCVCPCDLSWDTAQLALLPSDPSRSGLQSIPGTAPCPWSPRSTLPCTARRLSTPAVQARWPVCAVCAPRLSWSPREAELGEAAFPAHFLRQLLPCQQASRSSQASRALQELTEGLAASAPACSPFGPSAQVWWAAWPLGRSVLTCSVAAGDADLVRDLWSPGLGCRLGKDGTVTPS